MKMTRVSLDFFPLEHDQIIKGCRSLETLCYSASVVFQALPSAIGLMNMTSKTSYGILIKIIYESNINALLVSGLIYIPWILESSFCYKDEGTERAFARYITLFVY
ncbi:hypothetical protein ACJX0J_014901 [Zea mays]